MKKTGKCPKCESREIYRLGKRPTNGISVMNIGAFSRALLYNYVCTACGYVESYVADEDKMSAIVKKGEKVQ